MSYQRPTLGITVLLALGLLGSGAASELRAQGQFLWGNNFAGVRAPIYGLDPANPPVIKSGNTAMGIPPGTQTYAGPLLEGTGFTVGIYLGSDPFSTMAAIDHLGPNTFRTGAAAGLTHVLEGTDPFRPPGTANVHYQFRVWGNQMGTITSWAQLMAGGGQIGGSGVSDVAVFTTPLGGAWGDGIFLPPVTLGIRSFQLTALSAIPEPSSWALLALGALSAGSFGSPRRRNRRRAS
ncbi:MAG: PEP-CTERM sorting domain-containing protein [Gammaproteobacteria bacterium]